MLGKLASMFVEIEGGPPPAAKQKDKNEAKAPEVSPPQPAAPVPTQPVPAAGISPTPQQVWTPQAAPQPIVPPQIDEEMVEFLAKAIEDANLPGFDYIEFRNALAQAAAMPVPEQQKFAMVFMTAQGVGLTKDKLLAAVDHYQGVLDKKKEEFEATVAQQVAAEVTKREERCNEISEEMQQLQTRLHELHAEQATLRSEATQQSQNIQKTAGSFATTWAFVSSKLQQDRSKIDTYIQ